MSVKRQARSNKKAVQNVTGWDRAISDAKAKIRSLNHSITIFELRKAVGDVWPGESATPLPDASQRPSPKVATQ
jgi:hypothetical protein